MASSTTSNYLHTNILNHVLTGAAFTPASTLYLALFTTAPALDGTGGTEVSFTGTNYARVAISSVSGSWTSPSGTNLTYTNVNELDFPVPGSTAWGTITYSGLYDAATGGNLYWLCAIGTAKPVNPGDGAPRVLAGQLSISRSSC